MVFFEVSPILDKARLDVFIVHELGEDEELLSQELISEVDSRVHDAYPVSSD